MRGAVTASHKKGKTNMKNITSEKIDNIVNRAFDEQTENVLSDFTENYEEFKKICDKNINYNAENVPPGYMERFANDIVDAFASIKTAQDNCVAILRETLKELLCEEQI